MELVRATVAVLAILCLLDEGRAEDARKPIDVWCDVDPGTGVSDVDDGLMLIQAFHSPELRIRGVSVVFGNAKLEHGVEVARTLAERFAPPGVKVFPGAAAANELGQENEAVRAMANALRDSPMTILAVGPITNVATLVQRHPELQGRIERIVMVAGRRPGQRFISSDKQKVPHRDFNFELDPEAMQAILDTQIPLAFAPWEVSSQVWLSSEDLKTLAARSESGKWINESSQYWLDRWEEGLGARKFNPFDSLAAGWLTHPQLIQGKRVKAFIRDDKDDRAPDSDADDVPQKPYLLVESDEDQEREIIYCTVPSPEFTVVLIDRLAGDK